MDTRGNRHPCEGVPGTVLAIAAELMASTRIQSILGAAGCPVVLLPAEEGSVARAIAAAGPAVVVLDLAVPAPVRAAAMAAARAAGGAVLAFGPHADVQALAAARAEGAAEVVARGALERALPLLVAKHLARLGRDGGGMAGPSPT